jgi:hypothetical protein
MRPHILALRQHCQEIEPFVLNFVNGAGACPAGYGKPHRMGRPVAYGEGSAPMIYFLRRKAPLLPLRELDDSREI